MKKIKNSKIKLFKQNLLKGNLKNKIKNKFYNKRNSLQRNKIFAEIFSLTFLGIMGFIVSVVGLQINKRSAEIYQKQLEILDSDREPHFTIKCENIYEEVEETVDTNEIAVKRYTIKNEGGSIYDVSIEKFACAIIGIPNEEGFIDESNIFKYTFFDFFFYNEYAPPLYHPIEDGKDIVFYKYDLERTSDEFEYNEEEFQYEDIFWILEEEIEKRLGCNINLYHKNFINITYTNYKNEKFKKRFEFEEDNIWISNEEEEGIDIGINFSKDINEMADQILETIEDLKTEKQNKDNIINGNPQNSTDI